MRSSETFVNDVCRVFAGGRSLILTGNVGDVHVAPEGGSIIEFESLMALAAASTGRATARWTPATGTTQVVPPGRAPVPFNGPGPCTDLADAMPMLLAEMQRSNDSMLLILDWSDASVGRAGEPHGIVGELLATAVTDPVLARAGHRLAVIDRSGHASAALRGLGGFQRVNVPLPDFDERVAFLLHFECVHRSPLLAPIGADETVEGIAAASNGLSLRRLLSLMGELRHDGRDLDAAELSPTKREFLVEHTEGTLRLLQVTRTLDQIAGLHNIRLLLDEFARSSGEWLRHMILAGPPGGGKSSVVAAIAHSLRRTPVELGNLRAQYVGESERRTELMIATADAMAPVLLFIDEIDQTLSGDGDNAGDSGVSKRINAKLWEWTGEVSTHPRVLVIGATNKPASLGSRVHDRFTIVPIVHPDPVEAVEIMRITAAINGRVLDVAAASDALASSPALRSGRTLSGIVINAARIADVSNGSRVNELSREHVHLAIAEMMTWSNGAEEELMALDAIRHTRRRDLLPWEAARRRGVTYQIPSYLDPFVGEDGEIDTAGVDARIRMLRRDHAA